MIATHATPTFERWLDTLAGRLTADRDVAAAYLFGSRARGDARPGSDVDLAVILDKGLSARERWRKRLELIGASTSELCTDAVDLLILEDAPVPLAHRVIRDGRLLVDNNPKRRVAVVEDVLRRYLDEAWLRDALDRELKNRLLEGRFAR
ncbi:MAG: nucleotidyltransferase domain-containing protein [Steroidobacteraceae bacterium]|nr:nucleotidyltransferase domain-containing protein [Nevskiaceae bacterium]MCP5360753.1 nucleotidyltransferase domain-containing protein [Nevskiaceae bacterium]